MDIKITVGQNIRHLRNQRHMTQEDVAYPAGISVSCLSNIERGRKECRIGTLKRIAETLDVSPSLLIAEDAVPGEPTTDI